MLDGQDQVCIKEEVAHRRLVEAHRRMPDGKLVATMHVCPCCGNTFLPKKGRTRCPLCFGHLKEKTIVVGFP